MKDEAEKAKPEYEAGEETISTTSEKSEMLPRVQITLSELLQRLNRNIMNALRQLRKSRGTHTRISLGEYRILDINRGFLVEPHTAVSRMEKIARELGLLQTWEEVEK